MIFGMENFCICVMKKRVYDAVNCNMLRINACIEYIIEYLAMQEKVPKHQRKRA